MESVFVKMAFKRTFMAFAVQCEGSQDVETVPLHRSREDMRRASFSSWSILELPALGSFDKMDESC